MGKARSEKAWGKDVDEVTQRRAKTAADKNQEVIHLELCPRPAGRNHPAGRRFCRKLAVPARIARRHRQTKGGSQDAAAPKKISSKNHHVIPGRREASNPESRDSPMRNCASEVWSFGSSRNDGEPASGFREQLVDILPVHQVIDPRLQIIRPAIAIIDVVGVLPDVDAEDRGGAMNQRVLSVGRLGNLELAILYRQPRPPRTELADTGGGEIGLEFLEPAKVLGDLLLQAAR